MDSIGVVCKVWSFLDYVYRDVLASDVKSFGSSCASKGAFSNIFKLFFVSNFAKSCTEELGYVRNPCQVLLSHGW
jgi:hypothetical protein